MPPLRRRGATGGAIGFDAKRIGGGGPEPGFLGGRVAIVFFPDGLGWSFGAASLVETFLTLVFFADFPGLTDGLCAVLSLALLGRLAAEEAFLAGFFLPAGAFFLAANFFADMALASKTPSKGSGRLYRRFGVAEGGRDHCESAGKTTACAGFQPGFRCSATTVV